MASASADMRAFANASTSSRSTSGLAVARCSRTASTRSILLTTATVVFSFRSVLAFSKGSRSGRLSWWIPDAGPPRSRRPPQLRGSPLRCGGGDPYTTSLDVYLASVTNGEAVASPPDELVTTSTVAWLDKYAYQEVSHTDISQPPDVLSTGWAAGGLGMIAVKVG